MGRRKQKQKHFENVELIAAGGEGHALAKIEGKVIFVKYGAPGEFCVTFRDLEGEFCSKLVKIGLERWKLYCLQCKTS